MSARKPTYKELAARLAEAEKIIEALHRGEGDAVGSSQHVALLRLQEAEKALRESEAKHRLILESISEVVYMLKATPDSLLAKTVEFVSRQAESIIGCEPEEFMRDSGLWASLIHPDDRQAVEQATRQIYASRSSGVREYRMRHGRTGEYRWMEDRVVPQLDDQGNLVGIFGVARDITERKRAEEQLRFQADILCNVHNSVIVTDLAGKIVYWNEGATTVFGYSAEEMLGQTPAVLSPDQDPALLAAGLKRIMEGEDYIGAWKGRRKDGATVWIDIKTTLMQDAEGRAVGFIGVSTDVTERRRAEAALAESEKRFRVLIERSYDAIALISADGTITYRSPTATQISGFSPEELTGMSIFTRLHPDDLPRAKALFAQVFQEPGRSVSIELRFQQKDGSWRWLEATGTNLLAEPNVRAIVANYRDITDRKQGEAERERLFREVRESREQLQTLSQRLVQAQEAERHHLARELHDEIGQALTGLKILLEIATSSPGDAGAVGDQLGRAQALVEQITTQVHDLSLELRPPVLDDLGLLPALLWYFERYTAQTNVRVTVEHRGVKDRRFAAEVETAVYRIVQEALTNVARHAGVREAVVRLWADQDTLGVQVEDRGRGFDPQAALASSGLSGMRERARLLGGQFEIESAPGAGATLTVELPLGGNPLERRERAR